MLRFSWFAIVALLTLALPVQASKCYGEHECGACKNCRYCKNCNSGGELCSVYYQSRHETPPWEKKKEPVEGTQKPKSTAHHKKAAS